jgi:hypothetical protein
MIRQSAELLDPPIDKRGKSLNGHSITATDDGFEPDMELDDPLNGSEDWDKMETEEPDMSTKYQELLQDTVRYGQELRNEFRDDRSKISVETFKDMWSFYAYDDPRTSPIAHMLDRSGRVPVAEELNSAILGIWSPHAVHESDADNDSLAGQVLLRRR